MYNNLLTQNIENFGGKIEEYARLILEEGLHFQKGWALALECPVISPDLARACVKEAFKMGASDVLMSWWDPYNAREKYINADMNNLGNEWDWAEEARQKYGNKLAFILIESYNSDFYNGIEADRAIKYSNVVAKSFASYKKGLEIPYTFCVAASHEWAWKVLPDMDENEAYIKLWNTIFNMMGVDGKGNATKNWSHKVEALVKYRDILNNNHFKSLKITTGLGTDVEIGLPEKHVWVASPKNETVNNLPFCANMPTEEIFSIPEKTFVNGKIVASRPIASNAGEILDATFEIKNGEIVNFSASKGEDIFNSIMNSNENGHYLGEIAIVPYDTGVSRSGLTFYNRMCDENAGCHIAVGNAYSKCIEGGLKMSETELDDCGINICSFHEDCVFGTSDTNIIGVKENGEEVEVFKNGAFTL